nr:FCD domain-containing protein [Lysinibacter cavernae]
MHESTLDAIGSAIVRGELPPGIPLTIEQLEQRYGVSRSVIRDCLRSLQTMNLVQSKPRVGVTPRPASEWNVYEPKVIRWRLDSNDRAHQLRTLTQLRAAVEPQAAGLAAANISPQSASELNGIAGEMWAAGRSGDAERFLALDIRFHQLILQLSGNEMFSHLHAVVSEVLTGRTAHGLMPAHPHPDALQQHLDVAEAVGSGNQQAAIDAMQRLMNRTLTEMLRRAAEEQPATASSPQPPQ